MKGEARVSLYSSYMASQHIPSQCDSEQLLRMRPTGLVLMVFFPTAACQHADHQPQHCDLIKTFLYIELFNILACYYRCLAHLCTVKPWPRRERPSWAICGHWGRALPRDRIMPWCQRCA